MYSVNNLIGIPFKDKGRSIDGCDCMGLAIMSHKAMGQDIPDFKIDSDSDVNINSTFVEQLYNNKWLKLDSPKPPCIVVFGFNPNDPEMVTHVGTYVGDNKIIHTLEGKTSTAISLNHPFFKNKILGFYKYEQN